MWCSRCKNTFLGAGNLQMIADKFWCEYLLVAFELFLNSSKVQLEVIRTRFPCPGLLDILRNLSSYKKILKLRQRHGQSTLSLYFVGRIELHWLFHWGFGEMTILKWRNVSNSNSWFLAIIKGFSRWHGLPLFKLIFFS